MILSQIDTVTHISKSEFVKNYYETQKPVLIKGLAKQWASFDKWNLDYIYDKVGDQEVGLYDNKPADPNKATNKPVKFMKFREYIRLIKSQPSDLRIFFFIITDKLPAILNNFTYPDLGLKYFKRIPTLFFGGSESRVLMHYDVDLSDLLHFQFEGKKRVLLFDNTQSPYLYQVPLSVHTVYDIDYENPNYEKFPALRYAKGYEIIMEHGDALFMPSGYWHFNRYLEAGFSMSLRSLPNTAGKFLNMMNHVFVMRYADKLMRKILKSKWVDYKQKSAYKKSERALESYLRVKK